MKSEATQSLVKESKHTKTWTVVLRVSQSPVFEAEATQSLTEVLRVGSDT